MNKIQTEHLRKSCLTMLDSAGISPDSAQGKLVTSAFYIGVCSYIDSIGEKMPAAIGMLLIAGRPEEILKEPTE